MSVFSHWALDAIAYNNLPVALDDSPRVGLSLVTTGAGRHRAPGHARLARRVATGEWLRGRVETRIWWSPGSASKAILKRLEGLGYRPAAKPERFIVKGKYGPLRDEELERAKAWGAALAQTLRGPQ